MNIKDIAEMAHETNAAYCRSIADYSQPTWSMAPSWQTDSAINGVQFHLDNPNAEASASHESWMKQKLADGWKYGPAKDPVKKEHPCMVPFDKLPEHQQIKDHLFKAIVHALKPFLK